MIYIQHLFKLGNTGINMEFPKTIQGDCPKSELTPAQSLLLLFTHSNIFLSDVISLKIL